MAMPLPLLPPRTPLAGPRSLLPRDSIEYASTTLEELRFHWAGMRDDERRLEKTLTEIEAARIHERYPVAQPYGDLNALCLGELGAPLAEVRRTAAEVKAKRVQEWAEEAQNNPILTHEEAGAKGGRGNKASNDITSFRGTAGSYLSRRLARKFPEIAARQAAGEFSSVRAAALEAGIVKPTFRASLTVDGVARAVRRHFAPDQIAELVRLLEGEK